MRRVNGVGEGEEEGRGENVKWALGKAGEDRVHVVVSEEHGRLFVGIYDGFNRPNGPEFLMGHLYKAVFGELKGLFWDDDEDEDEEGGGEERGGKESDVLRGGSGGRRGRRKLWEYFAEEEGEEDGIDLSRPNRFTFSVDDALSVSNVGSAGRRRSLLLLSRLKQGRGISGSSGWVLNNKRILGCLNQKMCVFWGVLRINYLIGVSFQIRVHV